MTTNQKKLIEIDLLLNQISVYTRSVENGGLNDHYMVFYSLEKREMQHMTQDDYINPDASQTLNGTLLSQTVRAQ